MSRITVPVGKLAEHPYRLDKIERNIYSIEELCYSLVQSAPFLDASFMDPQLVTWIREELGLPKLADKLTGYLGKERALSHFVSAILRYAAFIPQDKQLRTRQIVASGQGMEPFERRLARADAMARSGQSYQAIAEYELLLQDLPEPEREMRAGVSGRMGDVYAKLFRFRTAAECYKKAYDVSGNAEDYLHYLAAVRFSLPDDEYVSFVAEHPESHNASLELERRLKAADASYARSEEKSQCDRIARYQESGQKTNYEIALVQTLQKLKDGYRLAKQPRY